LCSAELSRPYCDHDLCDRPAQKLISPTQNPDRGKISVSPPIATLAWPNIVIQKPTDADWILKAMVAVAAADGRLDAREVGLIRKVYQDLTGRSVDVSGVVMAVQAYATKRDVLAELSIAAGSMSSETKEEIVRAAYLALLADTRVAEPERKKLKDIATALRVTESELEAIIFATDEKQ
jgi:uncharacterized membrane protein YebE (DUF533 family)